MKKVVGIVSVLVFMCVLLAGCGGGDVSELEAAVAALESSLANNIADMQNQVNEKNQQITDLNDELTSKDSQIADLNNKVDGKDTEISNLNDSLTASNSQISDLNNQIEILEAQISELESQIPQLRDPTYEEAVAFINEDKTNEEVTYDYALAAMLVAENAAKQGIKAYWVIARLGTMGYNFVGFNTTDKGWIYFAANVDYEVVLIEGEKYTVINDMPSATFDDTIISIHYLPIP